jgi:hypothetical protein
MRRNTAGVVTESACVDGKQDDASSTAKERYCLATFLQQTTGDGKQKLNCKPHLLITHTWILDATFPIHALVWICQ